MEPVPETERMEEFRTSPVPTLRIYEATQSDGQSNEREFLLNSKPPTIRRATDPTPSSPSQAWPSPILPLHPRNISPYSRGHVRSRSSASAQAPVMSRAKSMPGVYGTGFFTTASPQRPSSPAGSPNRARIPRKPVDDIFPGALSRLRIDVGENPIAILEEDEETPRATDRSSSPSLVLHPSNTFPRTQRPCSPLRNLSINYPMSGGNTPTTPTSLASSPSYQTSRFGDSFERYTYAGSASSVPTTPSSIRSRSPSISSLETIPDSPGAEEAALEAERIAQLKAAADAADGDEAAQEAKRLLDATIGRGRTLGTTFGSRDKRKRWSVCGAERRGDLDLETIWED